MKGSMWSRAAAAERREHLEQQRARSRAAEQAAMRDAERRFQEEQRRLNDSR